MPSCTAIAARLAALPRKGSSAVMDRWEDLRTVQIIAHQSFAIALGALWERTFRDHLRHSAWIISKPASASLMKAIIRGDWQDLCKAFERVRGFSLARLPTYLELEVLYLATSAIRHGNGYSADTLQAARPDLFNEDGVRTGYLAYFSEGGDAASDVKRLDIPLHQIETWAGAIADFWRSLDGLRLYHGRRQAAEKKR